MISAILAPKAVLALRPVPTAVPPMANSYNCGLIAAILSKLCFSAAMYPDNSCPKVKGVASCKCVRPTLITSQNATCLTRNSSIKCVIAISTWLTAATATICIAVGKISFDDCPILT